MIRAPLSAEGFAKIIGVSRETQDHLQNFVTLLKSWNRRINLVGRDTIGDIWRRHILDSAQLFRLIPPETRTLVMGVPQVHLIESDGRKAVFLREAIRATNATAVVHLARIERIQPFIVDVVTARALAPLSELLRISEQFRGARTICLFPKGRMVEEELTEATKAWHMQVHRQPSLADPLGSILRLEAIARDPNAPGSPRTVKH
jgi:16S rRNA (guanine527-N7)-methyltransferase